jgi:two-component system, cell cycle response regulator
VTYFLASALRVKMEDIARTMVTVPGKWQAREMRDACLIHIYPTGPNMGRRYPLATDTFTIGRGDDCELKILDSSVSRRHAQVEMKTDGYFVSDMASTNGTFLNDRPADSTTKLNDGDYLRVGNCLFRFLAGGNVEAHYHEEIYRLTIIDALTQTYNVRYFNEFLEREITRCVRHERPLSLLMFDIDRFKSLNDTHGHLCGDFVLRELSHRVKDVARKEDLFARYGGEEFACVLVETQETQAVEVAERIRSAIADTPFKFEQITLQLTVSVGVSCTVGKGQITMTNLIEFADANLYKAKNEGRNRVVV